MPEDGIPHRRERAARAFARPRRGAPAGPSRIGPKRARPLPERQLVRRADRSARAALHDQPASAAPRAWPSSRYRYGSRAAARPAPRLDPDGCRHMLGPVIGISDAVHASAQGTVDESALYQRMAAVPERIRRRHSATGARTPANARAGGRCMTSGVGADGEAALGGHSGALRLARRPPGAAPEPSRVGAGPEAEARRDEECDVGAHAGRDAGAPRAGGRSGAGPCWR